MTATNLLRDEEKRPSRGRIRVPETARSAAALHAMAAGTAVAPDGTGAVERTGGPVMDALETTGFLPSAMLVAAAGGTILVVVIGLLLQKAARTHLQEQRGDQLRKRVTRAEAQWREVAM